MAIALVVLLPIGLGTVGKEAWAQTRPLTNPTGAGGSAGDRDPQADDAAHKARNRINLRIGADSANENGRPVICMEVRVGWQLSVEGCGTGSGILHHGDGAEMAHFRAKWLVHRGVIAAGQLRLQAGVGFAELQLGDDRPGFSFTDSGAGNIETAGPEGALSLSWLRPMAGNWEFLVHASAGMAWMPHASDLVLPQDDYQPFVAIELGAGW